MTPVQYTLYQGQALTLQPGHTYGYLWAGNGAFKYGENDYLRALLPLAQFRVAGLPSLTPFVHLRRGKLPATVLRALFTDARAQAQDRPIEVMYHVRQAADRLMVERPEQDGSAASLRYKGGDAPDIVMDLHSHCELAAFFSSTDNADEQGFRLYGVIGNIFTRPTARFRVGLYGDFWTVGFHTLFQEAA